MSIRDRWEAMVTRSDGCWLWSGALTAKDGYGQLWVNGRHALAHRLSWEFHAGAIPGDLLVLHKCDVRRCVNPDHLFLGTHKDNADDKVAKGRANSPRGELNGSRTHPERLPHGDEHWTRYARERVRRGSSHRMAKLSEEDVATVHVRLAAGDTQVAIGRDLGVSNSTINKIARGHRWSHV